MMAKDQCPAEWCPVKRGIRYNPSGFRVLVCLVERPNKPENWFQVMSGLGESIVSIADVDAM